TEVPVTLDGSVSGPFGITKSGPASLTFGGITANSYTGTTEVVGGTLLLGKMSGVAVPGALLIDGPATVKLSAPRQIAASSTITFDDTSGTPTLDLNNNSHTVDAINSFQTGAAAITLRVGPFRADL